MSSSSDKACNFNLDHLSKVLEVFCTGPWLIHCHNELHVEQGMSMVIEVGDPDSWPQDPNPSYKCGQYKAPKLQTASDLSAEDKEPDFRAQNGLTKAEPHISIFIAVLFYVLCHGNP